MLRCTQRSKKQKKNHALVGDPKTYLSCLVKRPDRTSVCEDAHASGKTVTVCHQQAYFLSLRLSVPDEFYTAGINTVWTKVQLQ